LQREIRVSIEIVDDYHQLMMENKKLRKENEYLRSEMTYVLKKLKEFEPTLDLCIESLDIFKEVLSGTKSRIQ
jgi:hypothetical protein